MLCQTGTLLSFTVNLFIYSYIFLHSPDFVPVVELVNVLNVSKNNVVLVGETSRDVLRAARHFPQVSLHQKALPCYRTTLYYSTGFLQLGQQRAAFVVRSLWSNSVVMYLDALLQVSDVNPFCLKELRHDVPENMHRQR